MALQERFFASMLDLGDELSKLRAAHFECYPYGLNEMGRTGFVCMRGNDRVDLHFRRFGQDLKPIIKIYEEALPFIEEFEKRASHFVERVTNPERLMVGFVDYIRAEFGHSEVFVIPISRLKEQHELAQTLLGDMANRAILTNPL